MAALGGILQRLQQLAVETDFRQLEKDPTFVVAALSGLMIAVLLLKQLLRAGGEETAKGGFKEPRVREPRGYTRAEVAQHKTEDDLWLILQNRPKGSERLKVYDVTSYFDHHPGGDAILTNAGGDCTEGFHGIQHPATVYDLVEEYCIGWLEDP